VPAILFHLERVECTLFDWRIYQHEAHRLGVKAASYVEMPGGPDQWRSVRTTNAIERLHEEFKRRI
jgi:transposase-like protein